MLRGMPERCPYSPRAELELCHVKNDGRSLNAPPKSVPGTKVGLNDQPIGHIRVLPCEPDYSSPTRRRSFALRPWRPRSTSTANRPQYPLQLPTDDSW